MKLTIIRTFVSCVLFAYAANADAASLAFVGFNADGTDGYSLATFEDVSSGTVVNFTDDEWNGTAFADSNEADWSWTATSDVPAGTVINFFDINNLYSSTTSASASTGTITPNLDSSNNPGFSNGGDAIYAYTGTRATPNFLALISSVADDLASLAGLLGGHAVQLSVSSDGAKYIGPRGGEQQFSDYLPLVADVPSNWSDVGNGTGDNNFDATPFSVIPEPSTLALALLLVAAAGPRVR
jgi:hypothetical protein